MACQLPELGDLVLHFRGALQEQVCSFSHHLFYFVKIPDVSLLTRQRFRCLQPGSWSMPIGGQRRKAGSRMTPGSYGRRICPGFTPEEDARYFPRVCGTFRERATWHTCQMPERLLARVLLVAIREIWSWIHSPAAALRWWWLKKLGRRFLGFELSANYAQRIRERLAAVRLGDRFGRRGTSAGGAPPTMVGRRLSRSTDELAKI